MHRLIKVEEDIVDVSEIIGFDLVEDGTSITQGGLGAVGMSLAGGALFGKTGALAGATIGRKKIRTVCSSMDVIILKDLYLKNLTVHFVNDNISRYSAEYVSAQLAAKECIKLLENITETESEQEKESRREKGLISETEKTEPIGQKKSVVDEILRLKQLLDSGVITEEEFALLKRKLIGISD